MSFLNDSPLNLNTYQHNETNLYPILPSNLRVTRYQSDLRVHVSSTIIPLGANFVSAPSYQSRGWTISIHPEGKRYAHIKDQAGITLVTEAQITLPGVSEQLDSWLSFILNLAAEKHVHLPGTSDLFLELDQESGTCNYYFVDHGHRTVFWLHTLDTISVGLPNSFSTGHLQFSLEENYWNHVEMFPETATQYANTALNELQVIFLNARADGLTSEVPTFPYTAEEDEKFIDLLQRSKEHAPTSYITTYVARLWAVVANHRFITHFGEDHCRMSFDQSILKMPESKRSLTLAVISKALFDLPNERRARLENIWVDDLVYSSNWRKFIAETVEDLKQKMLWNFALLIANVLMLQTSPVPALTKSSSLFCTLGLGVTLVLLQEQQKLVGTSSSTGAAYLDDRNTTYGFLPTAIVHSLPHASFVWALLLFAIQGFWMAFADLPSAALLPVVIPVSVSLVVASLGIWKALHPRLKSFEDTVLSEPIPPLISPLDQKEFLQADVMV